MANRIHDIYSQLEELETLRSSCLSNVEMRVLLPGATAVVFFMATVAAIVLKETEAAWISFALFALSFLASTRIWNAADADINRRIYSSSSHLAFDLEGLNRTEIQSINKDSLEMLESAVAAAANPDSVHYHSRLARAGLRALKVVGDEKTLTMLSELLIRQGNSEEQQRVLDSLIDCVNGIKGRIYRHSGNSHLLRPSAQQEQEPNDLLRPAPGSPIPPTESLLRPTLRATAGPE